ncbi:MAG: hypothetical protein ABSH42_08350 [Bryobacteraceae bacterium]|jgi:hypothetical protein
MTKLSIANEFVESERRVRSASFFQEALYQGTASAVPKDREESSGFSPCARGKASAAKALGYRGVVARLKPVP